MYEMSFSVIYETEEIEIVNHDSGDQQMTNITKKQQPCSAVKKINWNKITIFLFIYLFTYNNNLLKNVRFV